MPEAVAYERDVVALPEITLRSDALALFASPAVAEHS